MRKLRLRKKIYFKIKRFFKIPEGSLLPKYMIALKCILFPLQMFYSFTIRNMIIEDFATDSFEIFGMKYSAELFRSFAEGGLNLNVSFIIVKRGNGVITIEKVAETEHEVLCICYGIK